MARINIQDLPVLKQLDDQSQRGIFGGSEVPTEEISLNYTKIPWKYSRPHGNEIELLSWSWGET